MHQQLCAPANQLDLKFVNRKKINSKNEVNAIRGAHTLLGVDVTEITYHPSLSLSNKFNSNDTSYVNPSESLTVVKSLCRKHVTKILSLVGDFSHSNICKNNTLIFKILRDHRYF